VPLFEKVFPHMTDTSILFSNIGYARGIDGTLWQHISRFHRHLYCDLPVQHQVLAQVKSILTAERPDLCCFVEIDSGSFHTANYNQLMALIDDEYAFHDIADKYGEDNPIRRIPFLRGKSNAYLSKENYPFQKLYFKHGTKRLIYRIELPQGISVFFAHFSLNSKVRANQFAEVNQLVKEAGKPVIILADFNIMQGFSELSPLMDGTDLHVVNNEKETTFLFHRRKLTLDLCICSSALMPDISLRIIPQPFSDHEALLVKVSSP
jgi:endonuclease/exonuclease/phosphatase family metal-dependent hydrolase